MVSLTPVEGDPFSTPGPKLTPVEGNPFENGARSTIGDIAAEGAKGLGRGLATAAGDVGEAIAGPFGPSHHLGNLMADFGLGERPKTDPTYGAQLSHAAGVDAAPQTTGGKYAGAIGEVLGNPTTYVGPGGLASKALMGAASGAGGELAAHELGDTIGEGPARAIGSMIAGPLAGRAASPKLDPAQALLSQRGVTQMTPGQLAGGQLKAVEDAATSIPILGHFIARGRQRSIDSFNRAVHNQALEPIGEKLSDTTPVGHDAVTEVGQKLSDKYDNLLPKLLFTPDAQFAQEISRIRRDAGVAMDPSHLQTFDRIVNNKLSPNRWTAQQLQPPNVPGNFLTHPNQYPNTWHLQGDAYKQIESELTHLAGKYGGSADAGQQLIGDHLKDVINSMRSNLQRINPQYAGELRNINTGWAMFARIRDAASRTGAAEGVFRPAHLLSAIRKADKSVGKGAFARGDALMQKFGEAGQAVLPSKVPDSGTTGRALTAGVLSGTLLGAKAVGLGFAGAPFYTRPGMYLGHLLTRQPQTRFGRALQSYSEAGRGIGTFKPFAQVDPFDASRGDPYAP